EEGRGGVPPGARPRGRLREGAVGGAPLPAPRRRGDGRQPGARDGRSAPMAWLASLINPNFWSLAVPAAIVSGYWLAYQRAKQAGLETRVFEAATQWAVGMGLVISHIVEILFYHREKLKAEGWVTLLKFWEGLSSYGGFF